MNVSGFWWDYHRVEGAAWIDMIQAAYPTDEIKSAMDERTFWEAFENELRRGSASVSFNVKGEKIRYVYIGTKKLNAHKVRVFCLDTYTDKERKEVLNDASA